MESQLICNRCKNNALEHPGKVVCIKNSVDGIEVPDTYYWLCDECLGNIDSYIKNPDATISELSELYAVHEENKQLRCKCDSIEKKLKERDREIGILSSDIGFLKGKLEAYTELFCHQNPMCNCSRR